MKPMTLKEMEHQFVYNDGQDIDVEIYNYYTYERVGEKYKVYKFKLPNINDIKDDIEHFIG